MAFPTAPVHPAQSLGWLPGRSRYRRPTGRFTRFGGRNELLQSPAALPGRSLAVSWPSATFPLFTIGWGQHQSTRGLPPKPTRWAPPVPQLIPSFCNGRSRCLRRILAEGQCAACIKNCASTVQSVCMACLQLLRLWILLYYIAEERCTRCKPGLCRKGSAKRCPRGDRANRNQLQFARQLPPLPRSCTSSCLCRTNGASHPSESKSR